MKKNDLIFIIFFKYKIQINYYHIKIILNNIQLHFSYFLEFTCFDILLYTIFYSNLILIMYKMILLILLKKFTIGKNIS